MTLGLAFLYLTSYSAQLLIDHQGSGVQLRGNGGQLSDEQKLRVLRLRDVRLQHKGVLFVDLVDLMDGLVGNHPIYGRVNDYLLELGLRSRRSFVVLLRGKGSCLLEVSCP